MPVRIGFVGSGHMARTHAQILSQLPDAQIVAFCDVDLKKAQSAAHQSTLMAPEHSTTIRAYKDARKMLAAESFDALYICVPPHAHKDAEIIAAQNGCALFVEKPIANNLRSAERAAAAIEDAGVLCNVGYHFRYAGATERLQKLLAVKGTAQPAMAVGRWWGGLPNRAWWPRAEQSGGQIIEQATHLVDLARYLLGEVVRVQCVSGNREITQIDRTANIADSAVFTLEFANGAIVNISATCILGRAIPGGDVALELLSRQRVYEWRRDSLCVRHEDETNSFSFPENPYERENRAFIEAVATGKRTGMKSGYSDALRTLRVTLAVVQSAKSGKAVKL